MNKTLIWTLITVITLIVIIGSFLFLTAEQMELKKPAIYLYPLEDSIISVKLNITGEIIEAIPDYNSEWSVFVTKEGRINNQYDYLFYEADLNALELPETGWIVQYDNLNGWFDTTLIRLGLNEKEKNQFKEYWLNNLKKANYYEIKLFEDNFMQQNMKLLINPIPDTLIRLNFYFKPLKEKTEILEPLINTPQRIGFTVVEWGGMIGN